jgi:tetratricopeptide (TPR) repeat protein
MRPTIHLRVLGLVAGGLLSVVGAGLAAGQQAGEQQTPPNPPPSVSPSPATRTESPQRELTFEERADIFMARKSYADAVDYYHRALAAKGRADAALWNKLGIAHQQQMNYREARKAYKEAMRRSKTFAEPWNNLGTTYYLQDKPKKSLKYYRQAIKLNASNASFHLNLASSYYRLGKIDLFDAECRTALTLDPNVLTDRSTLGTVMQARGFTDVRFYFRMAKIFASLGRAEEAVRYLRRAFEDGFADLKLLDEDPDFKKIGQFPAYVELRKNPPKAIKD